MTASPTLAVQLAPHHSKGLLLRNPVLWAAGTFGLDGYGAGLSSNVDFQALGAVVAKTTTLKPRKGNPLPRVAQGQGWLLNSIGLQNPGIEAVLKEKAPIWAAWQVPVILSLAGESPEEFGQLAQVAEGTPGVAALELNLSCPNVAGGLDFGQVPSLAAQAAARVKASTSLPVLVKLTPNVTDIVAVARAAEGAGADAVTLINTVVGMALDPERLQPVLPGATGGISGPAIRAIALAMVFKAYRELSLPIVGVGGISCLQDALELMAAGATAVQIGTATFADPTLPQRVVAGLGPFCARRRLASIGGLTGAAHRERPSSTSPSTSAEALKTSKR
ncbi:MAG: dihydroorotate dehydrogenase [Chloroflexi bacterium]|nr:dihydroorotate dehydrogenase [Chloroflexota bacterium]